MTTRYVRPADHTSWVLLYRDPVDFRKASTGLAAIVERELGHNPLDCGLYVFTNRRCSKIKCLYYKALFEEKFSWPRRGDEVVSLTGQQFNWLLDGYDTTLMTGHKKLHYESVF